MFTDNSSWIRSPTCRLGARVVLGSCQGVRIREAMTKPFVVKDHWGECKFALHQHVYLNLSLGLFVWGMIWYERQTPKNGKHSGSSTVKILQVFAVQYYPKNQLCGSDFHFFGCVALQTLAGLKLQ